MSVQLRGEVTVLVTQCNYYGGPHHVHQLQFPVSEEEEEDYADIMLSSSFPPSLPSQDEL